MITVDQRFSIPVWLIKIRNDLFRLGEVKRLITVLLKLLPADAQGFGDGHEAFVILLAQVSQKTTALTNQFQQTTA